MPCSDQREVAHREQIADLGQELSGGIRRKMSEMNSSGRMIALTTAGAARSLGTKPLIARPSAQKQAAPKSSVTNSGPS